MVNTKEVWARLISLESGDDVDISGHKFTIGRAPENNLAFPENKLVSQNHCKITYEEDGVVYITDSSTNGTQVDGTKVKQKKAELHHGDEIHIVFKKNSTENNVAYIFELLSKKLPDTLESTQEYEPIECDEARTADPDEPPAKKSNISAGTEANSVAKAGDVDETEETLLCSICQEILHDCVSLQPCMHTFCAGCFSQWMKTSKACPTCRKKATSVARNHILKNLIEIYMKSHPEKQRPAEDIAELEKQNTIIGLNMKLDKVRSEDYSDEDDPSSPSSGSDDDDDAYSPIRIHAGFNTTVPVCRQCPGYDANRARYGFPSAAANAQPADAAAVYQCTAGTQRHKVCYCCMEMFPDRPATPNTPSVACEVCSSMFCHLYWGCKRPGCQGCINKLKDFRFEHSVLSNILLQNPIESNILKDYMQTKTVTLPDVISDTCLKLDRGDFVLNNDFGGHFSGKNLTSDSVICHRCGEKALRQFAYFYRKNIPATDLPDAVAKRDDCYWGKNCRTQKKPNHAERWNHICEQTRFN